MSSTGFSGEEIRGPQIPRRQKQTDLDKITDFAIQSIPVNGKPYNVDESMLFEDDTLGNSNESDI